MENNSTKAFVFGWTDNYEPGVRALKNSIKKFHPDCDIIDFKPKEGEDMVQGTAIERFRIAAEVGKDYDAIALMDADMFLTANCDTFFEAASKGMIITGSNGMIINFNKAYQKHYGIDLGVKEYPYPKVHTTVPIFINKENLDWFEKLYASRRIDHWDDFLYLNILGIKMGKDKKMICLPPYMFTGIHHWQLKPETAIMKKGDLILSGTEEQVYMIHGKWWDEGWLQDLMPTMEKYLKDEGMSGKSKFRVEEAIKLMRKEFSEIRGN